MLSRFGFHWVTGSSSLGLDFPSVDKWDANWDRAPVLDLAPNSLCSQAHPGMMATTSFLSMWLSNTASTAMMLPIANAILKSLFGHRDSHKDLSWESEENCMVRPCGRTGSTHQGRRVGSGDDQASVGEGRGDALIEHLLCAKFNNENN